MEKLIIVIGDTHCGHRVGLTPPGWQARAGGEIGEHAWSKFSRIQSECWRWYCQQIKRFRRPDCLIHLGDCIDGRGEKSGGVELITGDRHEQIEIAEECIKPWNARSVTITRGTPYHVGDVESWEDVLADRIGAKAGDHEWIEANGVVFDCKHHCGSSSVPYGRATAVGREETWQALWAELGLQPRADIILRGHVHYHAGQFRMRGSRQQLAMTAPALQAMGTRYGARKCSGLVDFGFLWFSIDTKGQVTWGSECAEIAGQKATAQKI